ncbi:ubiquitin-conjugating enzyme E2 U isoform X3 [Hyaena hyaena]|uniref:ubiquitin-conjugating enzyme E2 U isoform X3 n=1 Tax=Hyaena hyaena TaxID=95912 RepID=UPI001923DCDF|nr:ubiquitin-conjugating enzyme E2 U isoform X3 [Hyaena hyaena]
MHCRAYFLLERDFQELKENNLKGITAFPVSEDLMEWGADIQGLQNTFWQELYFQLIINFTSEYNFAPPVVKFLTIPFHPNVDQNTGRACIDFLDDPAKWNTSYTLSSILLTLQVMLSNPVLENPVNLEAAQMLIKDESLYKQIVLRLFSQPSQLRDDSRESLKDPDKFIRSTKAISFNDYYRTWSGIATSKATGYYRNPCILLPWLGSPEKAEGLTQPIIYQKVILSAKLQFNIFLIHNLKSIWPQRLIEQKRSGRVQF